MRIPLLFLCFLIGLSLLPAQNDLMIGQWRSHLPYQFGRHITQSPDKVYYTTDWAILAMDKEEGSVEFISKVEQLSAAGTELVKYDPATETLIVTYGDGVFDLIKNNTTTTFANIREDGNFFNRKINDISFAKTGKAYFSAGFGVIEFDMELQEFGFTANLAIDVLGLAYYKGAFYAATEEGIYTAVDDPAIDLKDISNWQLLDMDDGFPPDYTSRSIVSFQDKLYFDLSDTLLYSYDGQTLDSLYYDVARKVQYLTHEGEHLLIGMRCRSNCDGEVIFYSGNGFDQKDGSSCTDRPLYAIETPEGQVWYADTWRDLRVSDSAGGDCQKFKFNSPFDQLATEIVFNGDDVLIATEPTRRKIAFSPNGFYRLSAGQWEVFNKRNVPVMKAAGLNAFYRIAVSPATGKIFVGTFWDGLIEFDGKDHFILHNSAKSPLDPAIGDPNTTRVGGLAFDADNNLWIANHLAPNPIAVLKPDGSWTNNFPEAPPGAPLRQVVIDQNGYKWFAMDGENRGVLVYDSGILEDPTDDRARILSVLNSELPTNLVNCLAMDLDGDVWVGTQAGPVVFECGNNVFDDICQGSRRIVEVGGFNAFLLEDENVLTIAVDGANRKWFGTESGVFIQSANGEEQIAFFNKDNSPLFDNVIYDIAVNPKNGEAFIGTGKGLISYRSQATEGGTVNRPDAYAYPNPVPSDYTGPIAIKGLARDADVKITDISGQLIFETKALGGQAIWDGRDYNGRKASTGVYFVFSTSTKRPENPDAIVTKILLIN